jgi:hypothetical protein
MADVSRWQPRMKKEPISGGIHYCSDQFESMRLGEEVAIRFLREEAETYNEAFNGFLLTKFDATTITV